MRTRPPAVSALGLQPGATRGDIARAYRRLAMLTHPDVSGDPRAAQQFASLTDAYRRALAETEAGAHRSVRRAPAPPPRRTGARQFVAGPVHVVPQPFGSTRRDV
jgi:molecular chaperone DnaJ